ncbi:hypothetical protein Q6348_14670 [Isoptericola sp. b441]|uniref:Uncharacterized protein n=1 Tax=Actinotalea lenta TaxID=3064654 RepID=A0ABT9DC16_9CELL|nr:hypothetical protein [Isoptericola sp. b441]MDO8108438.1 hypothetical protein [Isoptericola sp. b441]
MDRIEVGDEDGLPLGTAVGAAVGVGDVVGEAVVGDVGVDEALLDAGGFELLGEAGDPDPAEHPARTRLRAAADPASQRRRCGVLMPTSVALVP